MKNVIEKLKEFHKKFSKFEFAIVLVFCLLVLFIPYRPSIIGFSDVNIHKQNVNLAVDRSKSFILESKEPVSITSLSVSGEVLGSGAVDMYLVDKAGNKFKIFSNDKKRNNLVTGFYGDESKLANTVESSNPVMTIKEGELIDDFDLHGSGFSGEFNSACSETCALNELNDISYELVAHVEPGTTLIINEIAYTTVDK